MIAWFYSNETLCVAGAAAAQVGLLSTLGLMMVSRRVHFKSDDWKQVLVLAYSMCGFVPFTVFTSMRVLDRDFKYKQFNKWEGAMTYVWRLIPQVYIPVDYYQKNEQVQSSRELYRHPDYKYALKHRDSSKPDEQQLF